MTPGNPSDLSKKISLKNIGLGILVIIVGGFGLAFLAGYDYIDLDPGTIIGLTIILVTAFTCCTSCTLLGSYSSKMPEYRELEDRFKDGLVLFEEEEWIAALEVFTEVMGPAKDHIRALYYGALCYDKLERSEDMRDVLKRYLELQPNDKEVWNLLARAHKRLFEYAEAQEAEIRASAL
ncbi:MAG: tetratricopeptide repeat protein [Candidatus Thorarchaeota archaeon]